MKKYHLKLAGIFLISIILSSFVFISAPSPAAKLLKIHMLCANDGRNDSFIIQLPNDQIAVLDTDYSPALFSKLNELNITKVDYIIATHEHGDHIGGLDDLINSKYTNEKTKVYYPKGRINATSDHYKNLVAAAAKKGLPIQYCVQGDIILDTAYKGKALKILVISPIESKVDGKGSDDYTGNNLASLGIKISYGQKSALMMADIVGMGETALLSSPYSEELNAQVVKVGHHGLFSNNQLACSDAFLDKVKPAIALITNGKEREVNPTVMANLRERKINYWTTNKNGYTWLSTDGERAWTSSEAPTWP